MATNGVKIEGGMPIKRDPDLYDDDEDKYADDDGELKIPAEQEQMKVWLAKLPKWLWESWADIADDEEIEIGKLRIYNDKVKGTDNPVTKLILHDLPNGKHAKVPKKYDVTINRAEYNNTVVFSEKDQPGFKSWRPHRSFAKKEDRFARFNEANRINKNKRYTSAIPKQVSLAGYVANEVTVTAVENEEYRRLTSDRFKEMFVPKHNTIFKKEVDTSLYPSAAASARFASFTTAAARPAKKKQTEKAVRISQEDLLDALNQCFKEYRYWSLRALKQRLRQPESYIKTVVEKIATLIRSGPFTMQYRLNPEYEKSMNLDSSAIKEEAAQEKSEAEDDDDDMDDGDDFEDVNMED